MKSLTWPKEAFKNFLTIFVLSVMFYLLYVRNELRDSMFVLITLVIKHYYDSNTASAKKDDTISNLSNSIPNAPKNEGTN